MVSLLNINELIKQAWESYEKALECLEKGDLRNAAEKAWLSVETMRKAIMVATKIPYEKTRVVSIALNVFSRIMNILDAEDLLLEYYAFQSTLHGLGFYEGILNEDTTERFIKRVELWLRKMSSLINKAKLIDARKILELEEQRIKVKQRLMVQAYELVRIRNQIREIINQLKASIKH